MASESYFEVVKPTYMENWPESIRPHTIKYSLRAIPDNVRDLIIELAWDGKSIVKNADKMLLEFEESITRQATEFLGESLVTKDGFFARLSSRSPKDAWDIRPPYKTGKKFLQTFFTSERLFDDLILQRQHGINSYVVVRPFVQIKEENEFRLFIKDRRLVAISQYFYHSHFLWIEKNQNKIVELAQSKVDEVLPLLELNDLVIDFIIDKEKAILLEINPFFPLTDPCLFAWDHENKTIITSDGEFEFRWLQRNLLNV